MIRKPLLLLVSLAFLTFALAADNSPQALLEAGHWKRLRQIVEPLAVNPKDAQAAYLLSCAKTAFGDLDSALELAQRAVSLEPGNSEYHLQLAVAYGRKANKASFLKAMNLGGQYKSELKKAVELDAKNVDALWELMEFYWHAPGIAGGDQKKARAMADDIMRINAAKGYLALADLAQLAQNKQQADIEDYYRKAALADPKSYEVQLRLAHFYSSDKQRNYELAEKHAQQAITLDPDRTGGYRTMAAIRVEQERWQDLDLVLHNAEARVPDDLSPYFQAGLETLLAGKDPSRAERYLRKYLTQEPEDYAPHLSRAHWRLGQALEKQGRKAEAVAELESALRLEPDFEEAKKDLKRLKQQ
ncbi:MAG TPA: tetratricopeptide repeat protein [Candidatus Angelobacter sp.]|nr:tetratricopeptide repeat protein [Candidatus Angelobacter sp.]